MPASSKAPFAVVVALAAALCSGSLFFYALFLQPKLARLKMDTGVRVPLIHDELNAFLLLSESSSAVAGAFGLVGMAWLIAFAFRRVRLAFPRLLAWSAAGYSVIGVSLIAAVALGAWMHVWFVNEAMYWQVRGFSRTLEQFALLELAQDRHAALEALIAQRANIDLRLVERPKEIRQLDPAAKRRHVRQYLHLVTATTDENARHRALATLLLLEPELEPLRDRFIEAVALVAGERFADYEDALDWAEKRAAAEKWKPLPVLVESARPMRDL